MPLDKIKTPKNDHGTKIWMKLDAWQQFWTAGTIVYSMKTLQVMCRGPKAGPPKWLWHRNLKKIEDGNNFGVLEQCYTGWKQFGHVPQVTLGLKTGRSLGISIKVEVQHNVPNGLIWKNMAAVSGIIILKLWKYLGHIGGSWVTCRRCRRVSKTGHGQGILIKVEVRHNMPNGLI